MSNPPVDDASTPTTPPPGGAGTPSTPPGYGAPPPSGAPAQPPYSPAQPPYAAPAQPPYSPAQPPYGTLPPTQPGYGGQPPYGQPPYPQGQLNPYAPPPAFGTAPPVPIGESFRFAWAAFKLDPVPWILATLIMFVVSGIGQSIADAMSRTTEWMDVQVTFDTPGAWVVRMIFTIIGYAIAAAFVQAALRAADGRRTTFADFTTIPNLAQALLAAVILGVATAIGYALLIIPGIIVQVLGAWYLHLALDRGLSAVDALKGSVQIVSANLGTTLLFGLAAVGVMILGALALGVGLFVALPMVFLASAFVFRRLTGGPVMVPGSASR